MAVPITQYTQGAPISFRDMPITKERYVFDRGPAYPQSIPKRAEDTLDYTLDLRRWLEPNERIISARAGADPVGLSIPIVQYSDIGVVMWITGGAHRVRHTVDVIVRTSMGKEKLFQFRVVTTGVAPLPSQVIIGEIQDVLVGVDVVGPGPDPDPPVVPEPKPAISLSVPSLLFSDTVVGQESAERSFTVFNSGNAPLTVTSLSMSNPGFTRVGATPGTIGPGQGSVVRVRFTPQSAGTQTANISVNSNAPGTPPSVALLGFAKANDVDPPVGVPQIAVSPSALAFGTVQTGLSQERNLTISNPGTAVLQLNSVALMPAGIYSIVSAVPATVGAGQSVTLRVRYAPIVQGASSASIAIAHNAGNNVNVALTGTATGEVVPDDNVYLTAEDGDTFVTEDGVPIIDEVYAGPIEYTAFTSESGDSFITEDGSALIVQ